MNVKYYLTNNNEKVKTYITPINYKIAIIPNVINNTFAGAVNITLQTSNKTNTIELHQNNLHISYLFIINNKLEQICKIDDTHINYKDDTVTILLKDCVLEENHVYTLNIKYRGLINKNMNGFYKCRGFNGGDYILCTKFEPDCARTLIPCFDVPDLKATFELVLVIDKNLDAISNTDIIDVTDICTNLKKVTFAKTLTMSTYLLAFVIGKFEYIESICDGIKIRVNYPKNSNRKTDAEYALDNTVTFLSYMNNYFGIKYPINKLDLVPIPEFLPGAMENFGIITFKPELLLSNSHMSKNDLVSLLVTLVHELVHQWLGNLVTLKYWNDLWLNEGLTTFFSYHFINKIYPKLNIWTDFYINRQSSALQIDNLQSTHAVMPNKQVSPKYKNDEFFNAIVYA